MARFQVRPEIATGLAVGRPDTRTDSADFTLTAGDDLALVTAGTGGVTVTLPPAADPGIRDHYLIKKVDASEGGVTVDGNGSETIDGAATVVLPNQWDSLLIASDGTNWQSVGKTSGLALSVATPSTIGADTDDYDPGTTAAILRLSTSFSYTLTGMLAPASTVVRLVWNVGGNNLILSNEDSNSSAANRFVASTGASITLGALECALLYYDTTATRWRMIELT